jgi:hypothetical protein
MITYRFPTNVSVDGVLQEYRIVQREELLGLSWMPFEDLYTQRVITDFLDRDRGATAPHNMGADPKIGNRPGSNRVEFTPIPHKETDILTEADILMPATLGTLGGVLDLSTEIGRITKARADKNFIRAEMEIWQALKGHLVIHENGIRVDETFPVQSYDAVVDWDELDTARPLHDFNQIALKSRFTGGSAVGAEAAMNTVTASWLLENRNEADLKGFQNQNFLNLTYSVEEVNKILAGRGLPTIRVYDLGYVDDNDGEVHFLADGEVVVKFKRSGPQTIGGYGLTPTAHREVNGQPAPGFFSIIEVNGQPNPGAVTVQTLGSGKNPKIEITGGFYGGPRLRFPRSIVNVRAKVT